MEIKHVYFNLNDVDYYDYTLYTDQPLTQTVSEDSFVVDGSFLRRLRNISDLTDTTIKPPRQSEIYITPKFPYPIEDVRNNYKIKRIPDSGTYNVIGPIHTNRNINVYGYVVAVFPSLKAIFIKYRSKVQDKQSIYREALMFLPNADYSEMIYKEFSCYKNYTIIEHQSIYKKLLDGTLTKPCVPHTNLNIAGHNQLTNDILTLVRKMGSVFQYEKDAEKNFIMQLNVLNQHNWREYPGTIAMLFLEIMRDNKSNIYMEVRGHSSRYSKVVKELIFHKSVKFASNKDQEFARQYVNELLGIGDCRYTTVNALYNKLQEINLSISTFNKLYDNIVRLTPKKFKEESEENN